jgi:hypothetical protein
VMKEPSGLDMSERIEVKQALEKALDAGWLCDWSGRGKVSGEPLELRILRPVLN